MNDTWASAARRQGEIDGGNNTSRSIDGIYCSIIGQTRSGLVSRKQLQDFKKGNRRAWRRELLDIYFQAKKAAKS